MYRGCAGCGGCHLGVSGAQYLSRHPVAVTPVYPPPPCDDAEVPKVDGSNTECCSDEGGRVFIQGKVGHGSKRENNTYCCSDKGWGGRGVRPNYI